MKMHLKMLFVKWQLFCLGFHVLIALRKDKIIFAFIIISRLWGGADSWAHTPEMINSDLFKIFTSDASDFIFRFY